MSSTKVESPSRLLLHLGHRRRAREQQHEIGVERRVTSRACGRGSEVAAVDALGPSSRCGVVSEPAVDSVTPKACRRSSPDAIRGQVGAASDSSDPCRRIVPIVYICAWQAPALQSEALICSRITLAAVSDSPEPPYCSGMSAASHPASVKSPDELLRIAIGLERPPSTRRGNPRRARGRPPGSRPAPMGSQSPWGGVRLAHPRRRTSPRVRC